MVSAGNLQPTVKGVYGMKLYRKALRPLLIAAAAVFALAVPTAGRTEAAVTVYKNVTVSSLTATQRKIVNSIMNQVKNSTQSVVTIDYKTTKKGFLRIWNAIDDTYFRYYSSISMKANELVSSRTGEPVGIRMKLYVTTSRNRYKQHLKNKAKLQSIARTVTKGKTTDTQKVIAINNYVCKKLTWRDNAGTLNVALNSSYAKCTGYATLFMALCEQSGLSCCQVAGYARGGGHDWNYVRIGNGWYYVDPTWNDTTGNQYLISRKLWSDHTEVWARIYIINFQACGYMFDI